LLAHRKATFVGGRSIETVFIMNKVKKFTTFDELKSCESKTVKYASALKKHEDFEKVIMEIQAIKMLQINKVNTKR
jgi:hypothetical protein